MQHPDPPRMEMHAMNDRRLQRAVKRRAILNRLGPKAYRMTSITHAQATTYKRRPKHADQDTENA